MNLTSQLAAVSRWFHRNHAAGIVLPDRWFGRPLDSEYQLTQLETHGERVTLVMSDGVTLEFELLGDVKVSKSEIELGPFKRMVFSWHSFGTASEFRSSEYTSGTVRLVRMMPLGSSLRG